jgi:hypothetical protein
VTRLQWFTGLAATALLAATAHAGGFAISEQTITAAGTGGAGAARAGEAGAAWRTPAALADDGGWRIGAGLVVARPFIVATGEDAGGAWSASSESPWSTPPHLDAAWGEGKLALGLAAGVPFGGCVKWPGDWQGRFRSCSRGSRSSVWRRSRPGRSAACGSPPALTSIGPPAVARQMDFIDMEGDVAVDLAGSGVGAHAAAWSRPPPTSTSASYRAAPG